MHRLLFLLLLPALPAGAQQTADTLFAWQGYGRASRCRVQVFLTPEGEERVYAVVLQELAANAGASTLDDARHLVELVGRRLGIDPVDAYWIFHWGAFSYAGTAPDARKELFLRATFRRTRSQTLGAPSWRLLSREEVEDYTDRLFR